MHKYDKGEHRVIFSEALASLFRGRDILYTLLFLFPFYAGGIADILYLGQKYDRGVALMAALACIGSGAVLGFLFGIPQAFQSRLENGELFTDNAELSDSKQKPFRSKNTRRFQSNTNLEQVSDWLTKILIGAGLVQIANLKNATMHLAHILASGINDDGKSVAFSLFLIIYFICLGFVSIYTITRLFLTRAFSRAEDFEEFRNSLENDRQAEREASEGMNEAMIEMLQHYVPPTTGMTDDPNKNKFGGLAEASGRRLTARIVGKTAGTDPIIYYVLFRVESTDERKPLSGLVKFFLHPSYKPIEVEVYTKNGIASLWRMAWGGFTIGAIADDGKTRLELDMAQLPDAPRGFIEL